MDQQCEFCKRKFRLAKLRDVMGMSDYPVQSQAKFCPYCGLDGEGRPVAVEKLQRANDLIMKSANILQYEMDKGAAANAELVEALKMVWSRIVGIRGVIYFTGEELGQIDAALARASAEEARG